MDVRGQKVVVVGLGRTATALCGLLLREGARPFVSELTDSDRLAPHKRELDALGVPYECGGHSRTAFDDAEVVIPSPGVPPDIDPVVEARRRGARVMSEMEFAWQYCGSRILAVTGTNGKTTTTELLRALIAACGRSVVLAGNNRQPFSAAVMADPPPGFVVLEVSSYQLELADQFRPWIGAVLNVTPDHLARHRTVGEYARVKSFLFRRQQPGDMAVVNEDDEWTSRMCGPDAESTWRFSLEKRVDRGLWVHDGAICDGAEEVARVEDNPLPGRHNLSNALAALTMARAGGFPWGCVLDGLRAFRGVEHRIEYVTTIDGVEYYNDSKSTNLDSLRVALESFSSPIVLLAGGRGKGADYRTLRDHVRARVKHLVVFGEDAALLANAYGDLLPVAQATSMEQAVHLAAKAASSGDVVLLSPACASFDMFDDFEHRGRVFKDCVLAYAKDHGR